jgi:hypothetical protein
MIPVADITAVSSFRVSFRSRLAAEGGGFSERTGDASISRWWTHHEKKR